MSSSFETTLHSEFIARWRLYHWIKFLETGDDSQLLIPEDKKMARQSKDKINRTKVMWFLKSIIDATGYPAQHKDDSSTLMDITRNLLAKEQPVGKYYETIKELSNKEIAKQSYSYIDNNSEIKTISNDEERPFTGADILRLFNGQARIYENKAVIAKKDDSGYCCLYFKSSEGVISPIKGNEAKIIGSAILADLAAEMKSNNSTEELRLIQDYAEDGSNDRIAEYYSGLAMSNHGINNLPRLTSHEKMIESLLSPLKNLYNELLDVNKKGNNNTNSDKLNELIEMLRKEMSKDRHLKEEYNMHKSKMIRYAKIINGIYSPAYDPKEALDFSTPTLTRSTKPSKALLIKMIIAVKAERDNMYKILRKDSIASKVNDTTKIIKKRVRLFNSTMYPTPIDISLLDSNGATITQDNQSPFYISVKTKNGGPYIFEAKKDIEGQMIFPINNVGPNFQILSIGRVTNNTIENVTGCLSLDMQGYIQLSSKHGNEIILGAATRFVDKSDVEIISQNIEEAIRKTIKIKNRINELTLKKISYLCLTAHLYQGGIQLPTLTDLVASGGMDIATVPDSKTYKFMNISSDSHGNVTLLLVTTTQVQVSHGEQKSRLHESIAVRTKLTFNIYDQNPVFTMEQKADLREVPELKPEYFFVDEQKPAPKFLNRFLR